MCCVREENALFMFFVFPALILFPVPGNSNSLTAAGPPRSNRINYILDTITDRDVSKFYIFVIYIIHDVVT
jgi:hypothetical protein